MYLGGVKMFNLKNTSKWNELFILNTKQVQVSRNLVNLEGEYLLSGLSELIYRRRKAILENELEEIEIEQNNLRNQLYEG